MSFVVRLLALAGVILSAAWFGSKPGWNPSVAFVAALSMLLLSEHAASKLAPAASALPQRSQAPVDRKLLEEFLIGFPDDGPLRYFATRTAANPFHRQTLFDLEASAMQWSGADREFLNPALEAAKRRLMSGILQFIHYVAMNTFPAGTEVGELSAQWSPKERAEAREHIDSLAQALYLQYQEFVRLARRVLLSGPPG
jgi:hypothetical protein